MKHQNYKDMEEVIYCRLYQKNPNWYGKEKYSLMTYIDRLKYE